MLSWHRPKRVFLRSGASMVLLVLLFSSMLLPYFLLQMKSVSGIPSVLMRPSSRPVFTGTTGDIEVNVTVPGIAVKVEIPREFVPVQGENDTSFVWSTINEDYWYYNVTDESQHYPYDPNAPWYVIVWNRNLTTFAPPQIVRFKEMRAPEIAGLYNVTIYVSTTVDSFSRPIFPQVPTRVLTILVVMARDWATLTGYVVDPEPPGTVVRTKGVVYAENQDTGELARALVNVTTGFFNLTGMKAGTYRFRACAGYYPVTGFAYSLTNQLVIRPFGERESGTLNMTVDRGAKIIGVISYYDKGGAPIKSLEHPWLVSLGFSALGVLNWTVEAYDASGKLVALDLGNTNGLHTDPYLLTVGKTRRYVAGDPVGTEFCGIGFGTYTIVARVFAYLQKAAVFPVTIYQKGQIVGSVQPVEVALKAGGVISGTIRFIQPYVSTVVLETPRQAETRVLGSLTGKYFGGHVLVEAYDWSSRMLRGVQVLNGTLPSGVIVYADAQTLKFYILGFSDYYNRTYSGFWRIKDYGIDEGSYLVQVRIRGYSQSSNWIVTLGLGENATVTVDMNAEGAIRAVLYSAIAFPGTYRVQMSAPWLFLTSPLKYRARVYHYNESGVDFGYAEVIIAMGQPGVTATSAILTFSGMNYALDEFIYHGWLPTTLRNGTYSLKAFLFGYLQATWPKVFVQYFSATALINMLIACEARATVVLIRSGVFYNLVENVSYRVRLLDLAGDFRGGEIGDARAGAASIAFSCMGFGGKGHFFYVTPDGTRWYDYGIDKSNYTVTLDRFGYLNRFERISFSVKFTTMDSSIGFILSTRLLNKITGVVRGLSDMVPVRLSWATITVEAFSEVTTTLDGVYWVFMPDGESYVKCSLRGYSEERQYVIVSGGAVAQRDFTLNPI